jgi:hypothetical protein
VVGTESQINHPRPLLIQEGSTWSIFIVDGAPQAHERLCGSVPAKNSIDHKERPIYRGVKELRELLPSEDLQLQSGPRPEGGTGAVKAETNRLNTGMRAYQRNRANIN